MKEKITYDSRKDTIDHRSNSDANELTKAKPFCINLIGGDVQVRNCANCVHARWTPGFQREAHFYCANNYSGNYMTDIDPNKVHICRMVPAE